jgi:hypothetical protein
VVIDLERGGFLEPLFNLPFDFAVPDLLFNSELRGDLGDQLVALGLRVEELAPDELTRATVVSRERLALSAQDSFAFALAEQRQWTLLTGDGALRQLAADAGIKVHGVLWLCDRLEEHDLVANDMLHLGLSAIAGHPRCRLPPAQIAVRLARYAGG